MAGRRLSVCLNDKGPDSFKLALRKARARPEIFDNVIGDVVGKIGWKKKTAVGSEKTLVAFSLAFCDGVAPSLTVAWKMSVKRFVCAKTLMVWIVTYPHDAC